MDDLLKCFDAGAIGFFESPTGTGKSLSVLCSSIAYLRDKNKGFEFVYDESDDDLDSDFDDEERPRPSRLIVATRTHTQIKELIGELKRLRDSAQAKIQNANQQILALQKTGKTDKDSAIQSLKDEISHMKSYLKSFPHCVSLASRKVLCVNNQFEKLSAAELNDQCGKGCPYYDESLIASMGEKMFEQPMDIEDLTSYGKSRMTCPYFASRASIHRSQAVFVPYQTLFHSGTRETLNLSLKNAYVVVDEAHNLVDALNALYTVKVTKSDLQMAFGRLLLFRKNLAKPVPTADGDVNEGTKFLSSKNGPTVVVESKAKELSNATRLIKGITALTAAANAKEAKVVSLNQFQMDHKLIEILENTFSLIQWVKDRKLVYSMCHGLGDDVRVATTEACRNFFDFVEAMGNTDDKGNIVINPKDESLTYLLLNPSNVFEEVASQASGLVLVGGTLRPFEDVIAQLTTSTNIALHCNGHVIPKENCLAMCSCNGPSGERNRFTYERRSLPAMFASIAEAVVDLSKTIPNGVIVFFTSFEYMRQVYSFIKSNGYEKRIEENKFLLTEPKEQSELDKIMSLYKSHIDHSKGAVLFAVINAKLSEGINFANQYCRCVMVVGMPFADANDIVLKQRMAFFDQLAKDGKSTCNGHQFYLNQCMRAVNQAIGRSFRNINDYAVVVLFDERYDENSKLLPEWVQRSYSKVEAWKDVLSNAQRFFSSRK